MIQSEVYRTVKLRSTRVNASWAPWWRAQARAIAHVAHIREPNEERREAYLTREMRTAEMLEGRA